MPKQSCTAEDYWALPEGVRAELIDGELWDLASPSRVHQEIVHALDMGVGNHIDSHGGPCKVYPASFAVNLFADELVAAVAVHPHPDTQLTWHCLPVLGKARTAVKPADRRPFGGPIGTCP